MISAGTLTVCENCSSNYHVSCHIRSPAPLRTCPKCALMMQKGNIKEEDEETEYHIETEDGLPRYKRDEEFGKSPSVPARNFYYIITSVIDKKVLVSCRA